MANNLYTVADFLQDFWKNQVGSLYQHNGFISFYLIGVGMEFLGRCLDDPNFWDRGENRSRARFEMAINRLDALKSYKPFLQTNNYMAYRDRIQSLRDDMMSLKGRNAALSDIDDICSKLDDCTDKSKSTSEDYDLYSVLRCGLVHEGLPKKGAILGNGYQSDHLQFKDDGLVIDISCLSNDFVKACDELLKLKNTDTGVHTNLTRKCMKVHSRNRSAVSAGGVTAQQSTAALSAGTDYCVQPVMQSFTATNVP